MARKRLGIFNRDHEDEERAPEDPPADAQAEPAEPDVQAEPAVPAEPEPAADPVGEPAPPEAETPPGDVGERIREAAQTAARYAEQRAMEEILALEEDFARAKDEASQQLAALEARLE